LGRISFTPNQAREGLVFDECAKQRQVIDAGGVLRLEDRQPWTQSISAW